MTIMMVLFFSLAKSPKCLTMTSEVRESRPEVG
jgi:hypothetical protein